MHTFLANNHDELATRCRAKVAQRPKRNATGGQLENGVPMFLHQLQRTLEAEERGAADKSLEISGSSDGSSSAMSEIGVSATAHGKELLCLGYSIDQVVHDYGDVCQSVTDLAFERDAPFTVDEFRTLNRCLDNAIADAVAEFTYQRDSATARKHSDDVMECIGVTAHDLRNALRTAASAVTALEAGSLPISGATGSILKRSHSRLALLVDAILNEVRPVDATDDEPAFSVALFIAEVGKTAAVLASSQGRWICAPPVDAALAVKGNRRLLSEAIASILQTALNFTDAGTEVTLLAYGSGDRILIDVKGQGRGCRQGDTESMTGGQAGQAMNQRLSKARESVEAASGNLTVKDLSGIGCVFTIDLPRFDLQAAVVAA